MVDQDPRAQERLWSCARPSDDLRTKLKALVEEWRGQVTKSDRAFGYRLLAAASIKACADQLAAILAESEPEPCRHCGRAECDGGCRERPPVLQISRDDIARVYGHHCDRPGCPACGGPDCEAKAKLPPTCPKYEREQSDLYARCHNCGQPRSAHEPEPTPIHPPKPYKKPYKNDE